MRFGIYFLSYCLLYVSFFIATGLIGLAKGGDIVQPTFLGNTWAITILVVCFGLDLVFELMKYFSVGGDENE